MKRHYLCLQFTGSVMRNFSVEGAYDKGRGAYGFSVKLRLQEDSVCYDVGAGTGSVSVEMALRAWKGQVYAIEKRKMPLLF